MHEIKSGETFVESFDSRRMNLIALDF